MPRITVTSLQKSSNAFQITAIIDELTKTIDAKILERHRAGHADLMYELPENFSISNMERIDAQLLIYTKLITFYKDGGFIVRIKCNPDPDGSFLYIKWSAIMDSEERQRLKQIITNHSL